MPKADQEQLLERTVSLIPDIPNEILTFLLKRSRPASLGAGSLIYRQGDEADGIQVLLPSPVAGFPQLVDVVWRNPTTKRELRLERIRGPGVIGYMEILHSGALVSQQLQTAQPRRRVESVRLTSARARTDVQLARISTETLRSLPKADSITLAAALAKRAAHAHSNALLALHDAFVDDSMYRLSIWLRQEAMAISDAPARSARTQSISQSEIAAQIGIRRDTLNQKLKTLEGLGLIGILPNREIVIHDIDRLEQIADLSIKDDFMTFSIARDTVSDELLAGNFFRARNLALDALSAFPNHPQLRHMAVLSTLRCGSLSESTLLIKLFKWNMAVDAILSQIKLGFSSPKGSIEHDADIDELSDEEDHDEEQRWIKDRRGVEGQLLVDISVLAARIDKDRALLLWRVDNEKAIAAAKRAYQRYAEIAERFSDAYCSINAAALAHLLDDGDAASSSARKAAKLIRDDNYWSLVTLMEACLIQGDMSQARVFADKASEVSLTTVSRIGMIASTCRQLRQVYGKKTESLRRALRQKRVIYATGHMPGSRPWHECESALIKSIKKVFQTLDPGALYCALAAGADIVAAEQALAYGAAIHVVLPTATSEFLTKSVLIGDAKQKPYWKERFQAVLEQAASILILEEDKPVKARLPFDAAVYAGNRHTAGLALLQADSWESECIMLSINDNSAPGSIAGTSRITSDWISVGHRVERIECRWREGQDEVDEERQPICFSSILFLWLAFKGDEHRLQTKSFSTIDRSFEKLTTFLTKWLMPDEALERRVLGNQMIGLQIQFSDHRRALEVATSCCNYKSDELEGVRVVLDFGATLSDAGKPSPLRVSALKGARDVVELPRNTVLMTEAFAAHTRLMSGQMPNYSQIGENRPSSTAGHVPRSGGRYFAIANIEVDH